MLDIPRLYYFHNKIRKEKGLKPLYWSLKLARSCRSHATEMALKNDLYHDVDVSREISDLFYAYRSWGENIGVGPDQISLHRAFMHSEGHRANILNPSFDKVGIGLKKLDGKLWVCVRFIDTT